ncbi:hypothetical protein FJZ26_01430 [Candidatus Parvarchaeota archaeon]|nr:hypothetical protein [Candidatus Parvarchaeota archaeon]
MVDLPFFKEGGLKKKSEGEAQASVASAKSMEQQEAGLRHELEILRRILARYEQYIEEQETKSITELKTLIRPHDQKIVALSQEIESQFHPYIFENDFLAACDRAIAHVSKIPTVQMPINFWLSFEDVEAAGACDDVGKAVLLCSMLRCLGSNDARVGIGASKKSYVIFSFGQKVWHVDLQKSARILPKAGAEKSSSEYMPNSAQEPNEMEIEGDRLLYSFNDSTYEDYTEQP